MLKSNLQGSVTHAHSPCNIVQGGSFVCVVFSIVSRLRHLLAVFFYFMTPVCYKLLILLDLPIKQFADFCFYYHLLALFLKQKESLDVTYCLFHFQGCFHMSMSKQADFISLACLHQRGQHPGIMTHQSMYIRV